MAANARHRFFICYREILEPVASRDVDSQSSSVKNIKIFFPCIIAVLIIRWEFRFLFVEIDSATKVHATHCALHFHVRR